MSQIHLTLQSAPRIARAFGEMTAAINAMLADPIRGMATYGDDLIEIAVLLCGEEVRDLPLEQACDRISDALQAQLGVLSQYLGDEVVPAMDRLTRVLQAARHTGTQEAPERGEHQANAQ